MKRTALALAIILVLGTSNSIAQTDTPKDQPKSATPAASADGKNATTDPGVRKLSRRERKDRRAKLRDKYQQFLAEVEPIMMPQELDTFLLLETDPQRDLYIEDFWRRRDVARGTTNRSFRDEYYGRLEQAKEQFKFLSSDRARMYLIHGAPNEIVDPKCDRILQPIEIWKYDYLPGFGHNVRFVFFIPRNQTDYRLWLPTMDQNSSLAELVSTETEATNVGSGDTAVSDIFFRPMQAGSSMTLIDWKCGNGEELNRAVFQVLQSKTELLRVYEPPPVNPEDVQKILRAVVIANPNAQKLPSEFRVEYPARQGTRTAAEMLIGVPKASAVAKDVDGTKTYSFDVTGEILKEGQLFENFRYRFDFPGDIKDEVIPLIVDRFLRPAVYTARLRVQDVHSGAESVIEQVLDVPEIFDTPEQKKQNAEANAQIATLKDAIESNDTTLRIIPLKDELLSGVQHIETMTVGEDIKAVEFYLEGKKVMVKRQPPFTLDLDFGEVPQVRHIRALALDENGKILTGDEIVVNTGTDPFRVRIVSPRVAVNLKGRTRVQLAVSVPDGKQLDRVQLFYNETPVATLFGPPYVQTLVLPQTEGVAYLRAVASLKDDPTPPVEDVVMINTPQFMEEVNVHLIELPTTVIANGHPINTLKQDNFKVLDEGKPVKISKFEYVKNLPLSIGMAVDTSSSMLPRMEEAQKAGAQFFKSVMKSGDRAFLVSFDSQPQTVQKWSTKLADVNAGLAKLRAEEATALYDAIVYSLYNFFGVKGQKALIVITDGRDTASKFSFDQAIEYARRVSVPIYAIGIGIRSSDLDVRSKLQRFCNETGGAMYSIDRAEDLGRIYKEIQDELRSQYVLGFYPEDDVKPGSKWREVSVQTTEGKAKTIRGYYP